MTDQTPTLNDALAQLKAVAGDDRRANAVLTWASTNDRAFLRTIGLTYRDSADEALRQVALAAADFVDHDTRPPLYDDATVLLNMSNGAYRNGDRVKALEYLERMFRIRPTWRDHAILVDYGMALGMVIADPGVAPRIPPPPSERAWVGAAIWLAGYAVLFAAGAGLFLGVISRALPALRNTRSVNPRVLQATVALFTWMTDHALTLIVAVGIFVVVDILVRAKALEFGAHMMSMDFERPYHALVRKLVQLQAVFIAVGLAGAVLLNNASSRAGGSGGANPLLPLWQFGVAVGYILFLTRHMELTYSLSTVKALAITLGVNILVTLLEYVVVRMLIGSALF